MVPKFRVLKDFPFSFYDIGDEIGVSNYEAHVMRNYPEIFKEITIQFEVLSSDLVRRLVDGVIFTKGDKLTYSLCHIEKPLAFVLTGWIEKENDLWLCFNDGKCACGIRKAEHLRDESIEYEWID